MKRNISVFILLILLASSFKYRTKTRQTTQPLITAGFNHSNPAPINPVSSFDAAIADLQKANREMAKGNPALFKSLWSHQDDVTSFGVGNMDLKGWKAVEANLAVASSASPGAVTYTFEKIASEEGADQGYLLQKEHYRFPDGRRVDLNVTLLFRKENNSWKIIHRHADHILPEDQSDKTSK